MWTNNGLCLSVALKAASERVFSLPRNSFRVYLARLDWTRLIIPNVIFKFQCTRVQPCTYSYNLVKFYIKMFVRIIGSVE